MNKKTGALLLMLLIFCMLVCGCESGGKPSSGEDAVLGLTENSDGTLTLTVPVGNGTAQLNVVRTPASAYAGYPLVRSDTGTQTDIAAAKAVQQAFEALGTPLSLTTDWVKRGEEVPADTQEVLVGMTNRAECADSLRANDFSVRVTGNRLAVYGGSPDASLYAAELFAQYFTEPETGMLLLPADGEFLYSDTYVCDTLTLNGSPLWEYGVQGSDTVKSLFQNFCLSVTGHEMVSAMAATRSISVLTGEPEGLCSLSANGDTLTVTASAENARLGARYLLSLLMTEGGISMEESAQNAEITISDAVLTEDMLHSAEPIELFVAPDGSDENDGSKSSPLATIPAARDRVRVLTMGTLAPVHVYLRGGDYYLTEGITFDENDSGIPSAPVTYSAYENETVNLYGGVKVDPSLVKKAENPAIVGRVLDKTAAEKLMQIDISSIAEQLPGFYSFGHTDLDADKPLEVYVGGAALSRSRYPNNIPGSAYLRNTGITVNDDGTKTLRYGDDAAQRVSLWSEDAKNDLYLFGYLAWDWTNEAYDATGLDRDTQSVTLKGGLNVYFESITENTRFYFFNLPEEIDVPGESYIDRDARIVYFLPGDNFNADDIYVSTLTDSIFTFANTRHISVENLNFLYTRGNAVTANDTADFSFSGCTVMHTSYNAASFRGTDVRISGCTVYDTAHGGFTVTGGDRPTLTSGESFVENCEIHAVNRDESSYCPGIDASSVGMVLRHNKLYDCTHQMVAVHTNDVLIEYNEFFDCVKESSDMGAIYFGRDPSLMGTVIRYNYFHDIGNPYGGIGQQSIFIDDGSNGAEIFGNIFLHGTADDAAIKTHGAQFSDMTNNVFINMPSAYLNAAWSESGGDAQLRWMLWLYDRHGDDHNIIAKIDGNDFDNPTWHTRYDGTIWGQLYDYITEERIKEYGAMSDEDFRALALEKAPQRSNILSGNVFVNIHTENGFGYTGNACTWENNYQTDDTGIFRDFETDLSFTDEALAAIREVCPEFEQLPFAEMGLR